MKRVLVKAMLDPPQDDPSVVSLQAPCLADEAKDFIGVHLTVHIEIKSPLLTCRASVRPCGSVTVWPIPQACSSSAPSAFVLGGTASNNTRASLAPQSFTGTQ